MPNSRDLTNVSFDFLNAELELGATFVRVARTELALDPKRTGNVLAKARKAVDTVREFMAKPLPGLSPDQLATLAEKCKTLQANIDAFPAEE